MSGHRSNWREEMPDYLGCCASLDNAVGRLRNVLKDLGIAENTLVIYTSDHACHFATRNAEYKRSCHDNSIRVPMIIAGPGQIFYKPLLQPRKSRILGRGAKNGVLDHSGGRTVPT